MTEPSYRCGKCGGTYFRVESMLTCGDPPKISGVAIACHCGRIETAPSLTAAFQKISDKPTLSVAERSGTGL